MNIQNLCMGCMKEKPQYGMVCPYCGFDEFAYTNEINTEAQRSNDNQQPLPLRTVVGEGYLIGKKLGAGGFGVSYVGYDMNFERKVAIKEFYPRGFANRDISGVKLIPVQGSKGEFFEREKENFAHEGKVLAQVNEPGIVQVLTFAKQNNTAYIVMEFLEGKALGDYFTECGRQMLPQQILEFVRPVVKSLAIVHEKGLVHRDISPDNIMLTYDGKVKLIDFGAALGKGEQAEGSPIGKRGYAPVEQLTKGGNVGPYSDVYAFCAMLYMMLTGVSPPRSLDRIQFDNIKPLETYNIMLSPVQSATIMQGLVMDYRNRIKNASDLYYLLYVYGIDPAASVQDMQKKVKESSTDVILKNMQAERRKNQSKVKIFVATACVIVAGFLIITVRTIAGLKSTSNKEKPQIITETDNIGAEEENSGRDDNGGATTETEAVSLAQYREDLYSSINEDRINAGQSKAQIDSVYESAANDCVIKCAQANLSTQEEWNAMMSDSALVAMRDAGIEGAGWVVRAYAADMTIDGIKQDIYAQIEDINSGVKGAISLENCSKMGISVAVHADGTYFWMVIYR